MLFNFHIQTDSLNNNKVKSSVIMWRDVTWQLTREEFRRVTYRGLLGFPAVAAYTNQRNIILNKLGLSPPLCTSPGSFACTVNIPTNSATSNSIQFVTTVSI